AYAIPATAATAPIIARTHNTVFLFLSSSLFCKAVIKSSIRFIACTILSFYSLAANVLLSAVSALQLLSFRYYTTLKGILLSFLRFFQKEFFQFSDFALNFL